MGAKFQLYNDRAGRWRWHLLDKSGEILAESGHGHTNSWSAVREIEAVKSVATSTAPIPVEEEIAGESTAAN